MRVIRKLWDNGAIAAFGVIGLFLLFMGSLVLVGCNLELEDNDDQKREAFWFEEVEYKGHIYLQSCRQGNAFVHAAHCPCRENDRDSLNVECGKKD